MSETRVYKTYMCLICGFIYDEAAGLAGRGHRRRNQMGGCTGQLGMSGMRCAQGGFRADRSMMRCAYVDKETDNENTAHDVAGGRSAALARFLHQRARHAAAAQEGLSRTATSRWRSSATATRTTPPCSSSRTTGTPKPTSSATAYGHVALEVDDAYKACEAVKATRRQGHARSRPDEAWHHRHRVRGRPGRLQDRVHPARNATNRRLTRFCSRAFMRRAHARDRQQTAPA